MDKSTLRKVSVVCPFYNEEAIIEKAAEGMIENLKTLPIDWELIVVNDGSTDRGPELIKGIFSNVPNAQLVCYPYNQGRGFALKTGITHATGDVIVTTEIDLSWGNHIVHEILKKFLEKPFLDAVVASPNIVGGGYKNVPIKRVLLSRLGNAFIRAFFTHKITMNTGMTRGYRKEIIQSLDFDENGKEFHLEVILKLRVLGYHIDEVPATLEWKDHRLAKQGGKKRKSSTNIRKIIFTHLNFAIFANPIRYFWGIALVFFLFSSIFLSYSVYAFLTNRVAIYVGIVAMMLALFGLLFFAFGVLTSQNVKILKELWKNQRDLTNKNVSFQ